MTVAGSDLKLPGIHWLVGEVMRLRPDQNAFRQEEQISNIVVLFRTLLFYCWGLMGIQINTFIDSPRRMRHQRSHSNVQPPQHGNRNRLRL